MPTQANSHGVIPSTPAAVTSINLVSPEPELLFSNEVEQMTPDLLQDAMFECDAYTYNDLSLVDKVLDDIGKLNCTQRDVVLFRMLQANKVEPQQGTGEIGHYEVINQTRRLQLFNYPYCHGEAGNPEKRRRYQWPALKTLLTHSYQSLDSGLEAVVTMIANHAPDVIPIGLANSSSSSWGGRRLNTEETLYMKTAAGLSGRQVERLDCSYNALTGQRLFATKADWRSVKGDFSNKMIPGRFQYVVKGTSNDLLDEKQCSVEFWTSEIVEVFTNHLKFLRTFPNIGDQLGFELHNLGICIVLILLGDHGGETMKLCLTIISQKIKTAEDTSDYEPDYYTVAELHSKDDYYILANTIMGPTDRGLKELLSNVVVLAEWRNAEGDGCFDFLLVPKRLFAESVEAAGDRSLPTTLSITTDPDGTPYGLCWDSVVHEFELLATATGKPLVSFRYLPLQPFLAADLCAQACFQGRPNHSNSKCMRCIARARDFQDKSSIRPRYRPLSTDEILQQVAVTVSSNLDVPMMNDSWVGSELEDERSPNDDLIAESNMIEDDEEAVAAMILAEMREPEAVRGHRDSDTDILRSIGFTGMPMLITAIPVDRWVPPILHMRLGLVLLVLNIIVRFIRDEVEIETSDICEARNIVQIAEENYQNQFEEIEATMCELGKLLTTLKTQQTKHKEISKSRAAEDQRKTQTGRDRQSNLRAELEEELQTLIAISGVRYDPNMHTDVYLREMKDTIDELPTELQAAKLEVAEANSNLKKALLGRTAKPIEDAFTNGLDETFKVTRQKYHGGAIVGNDCNSMMVNRTEIVKFTRDIIMAAPPRIGRDQEAFDRRVDIFLSVIEELLAVLHHIFSILNRKSSLATDQEKQDLRSLTTYFGDFVRDELGISVTPKMHELETHAPEFLDKYGNTGIFDEGSIERLHHKMNGNDVHLY